MAIIEVGPIRGMRNVEGKLFVVAGPSLYRISNSGVAILAGPIPGVGRVSMAHNQQGLANELLTVNGSAGYVYNTNTEVLAKITDTGYPGAVIADYIDQYLAQVEPQGRFWFHSDLADAFSYNTLDRYEAEGDPDRIMSLLVSHREVLIFGRETIEPFVNNPTGDGTAPFERAANTVIECGCSARFSVRKMENSAYWLDDKRVVRRLENGYTPVRISTVAIESALDECTAAEIAQAYAFTWEPRGHKVYYLTVPGRFTFGYDVLTGQWHRRSSFGMPHWCVTDVVFWNGQWIAGDSRSSRLYVLDWNYKFDGTDELVRERTTGKLWNAQNPITLNSVELLFGVGGEESVPVAFPDQPTGPSITGEAPDGLNGDAYSFTYTAAPGDSPIARIQLRDTTLPDGWEWDGQTATISYPVTPIPATTVSLKIRVTDANGLYADHADAFVISQKYTLLVSGSPVETGAPALASATALEPLVFSGIPQSSGADLPGGSPHYLDGMWLVAGQSQSRYSDDDLETWQSGTIPFVSGGVAYRVCGGPDGWMVGQPTGSPHNAATSPLTPSAFSSVEIGVKRGGEIILAKQARSPQILRHTGGHYYASFHDSSVLARTDDLSAEYLDCVYRRGDDGDANTGITTFYDVLDVDGVLYATLNQGVGSPRKQLRRSHDGGATWPDILINSNPTSLWQIEYGSGVVLVISSNSANVWTSSNGFSAPISTGISTGGLPNNYATNPLGRMVVFAAGKFFIASGKHAGSPSSENRMVTTIDGLSVSAPIILPLNDVVGLATDQGAIP